MKNNHYTKSCLKIYPGLISALNYKAFKLDVLYRPRCLECPALNQYGYSPASIAQGIRDAHISETGHSVKLQAE